jgi:hypothetical protein
MRKFMIVPAVLIVLVLLIALPLFTVGAQTSGGACPGAPLPRLRVGDVARPAQVYSTIWQSPASTNILAVAYRAQGDTFTISGAQQCAVGAYNWYQVNFKGITGWVTEGTGTTYWVERVSAPSPTATPGGATVTPRPTSTLVPTAVTTPVISPNGCAGASAPRLRAGGTARPAQVYSSLRAGLGSSVILVVMYRSKGDTFQVVDGPYCTGGPHNWWRVTFKGTTGWVTEGIGSTYWVEPVS